MSPHLIWIFAMNFGMSMRFKQILHGSSRSIAFLCFSTWVPPFSDVFSGPAGDSPINYSILLAALRPPNSPCMYVTFAIEFRKLTHAVKEVIYTLRIRSSQACPASQAMFIVIAKRLCLTVTAIPSMKPYWLPPPYRQPRLVDALPVTRALLVTGGCLVS